MESKVLGDTYIAINVAITVIIGNFYKNMDDKEMYEFWKEWASVCRVYNNKDTFPINFEQLFDFAKEYHKKKMIEL